MPRIHGHCHRFGPVVAAQEHRPARQEHANGHQERHQGLAADGPAGSQHQSQDAVDQPAAERPFPGATVRPHFHGGDDLADSIDEKGSCQEQSKSSQDQLRLCQQQNAGQDRQDAAEVGRAPFHFVEGLECLEHLQDPAYDQEQSDQEECQGSDKER